MHTTTITMYMATRWRPMHTPISTSCSPSVTIISSFNNVPAALPLARLIASLQRFGSGGHKDPAAVACIRPQPHSHPPAHAAGPNPIAQEMHVVRRYCHCRQARDRLVMMVLLPLLMMGLLVLLVPLLMMLLMPMLRMITR
ncbi:GL20289 [Drosophila persimilis]|uniref:GL20289 n=1 Tax=Drosophila persimilis TaxID=7234 RepID=B4GXJ1_DROPE|nr:GL20289 [Drosophila persimilis]